MPKLFCSQYVFPSNQNYSRKCKNGISFRINSSNYCWGHANKLFREFVIYIQRVYRAYKVRKLLKNIYYNLPTDIQRRILYFVREQDNIKKWNNSIRIILINKLKIFRNDESSSYLFNNNILNNREFIKEINKINNIYNLLNKYFKLFIEKDYKFINRLYYKIHDYITSICNYMIHRFHIDLYEIYNSNTIKNYLLNNINSEDHFSLFNILETLFKFIDNVHTNYIKDYYGNILFDISNYLDIILDKHYYIYRILDYFTDFKLMYSL